MTQTPLGNVDCRFSRLLYSNLLATSIFTETPVYDMVKNISLSGGGGRRGSFYRDTCMT